MGHLSKTFFATVALALSFTMPVAAGPLEDAKAYDRGDYATALRLIRPLADQGDAAAQYLLGSTRKGKAVTASRFEV